MTPVHVASKGHLEYVFFFWMRQKKSLLDSAHPERPSEVRSDEWSARVLITHEAELDFWTLPNFRTCEGLIVK